MGFLPPLPSGGKRMNYGISATSAIRWQKWQKDELWDFCHFLPSGGKSGKRMNYGIFATSAIRWQKWQKDELWDFCHFCHQVAKG